MNKEQLIRLVNTEGVSNAANVLSQEYDIVVHGDVLQEIAIRAIKDDEYNLAIHICNALNEGSMTGFYNYDMSMGTLEEITPINNDVDLMDVLILEGE